MKRFTDALARLAARLYLYELRRHRFHYLERRLQCLEVLMGKTQDDINALAAEQKAAIDELKATFADFKADVNAKVTDLKKQLDDALENVGGTVDYTALQAGLAELKDLTADVAEADVPYDQPPSEPA